MEPSASPPWYIDSPDPETTLALAALLGRSIGARGLAIGLVGPLGSGKTVFVKGLAEGLGVDPRVVSSPTFVIAQQYAVPEGPELLHHLDFYRLASEAELEGIGFLDLLGPGQVLAVEWLDRFPEALGPDRLEVVFLPALEASGEGAGRRIRVTAYGDEASRVLQDWAGRWERRSRAQPGSKSSGSAISATDQKLVVALLIAGWIGLDGAAGGTQADGEMRGEGCAALAPLSALDGGRRDDLGPLRVRCVDAEHARGPVAAAGLDGMARLLDGGQLDPNEASQRLLSSLPGIGPGRAAAIEAERSRAPFRSLRELERVRGIGPKTRSQLEPFLAVDSGGAAG